MKIIRLAFQFTFARKEGGTIPKLAGAVCLLLMLFMAWPSQSATNDFKWNQPPASAYPTNVFYGWNQPSEVTLPGMLIAADDWVCNSTNPVTKIRWWGSFLGWASNMPPSTLPNAFQIVIYKDVPPDAVPWSRPGDVVWTNYCTNFTSQFVGYDYDPRTTHFEACFLYEQTLTPSEYFTQPGPPGTIYWISVAASYQLGPDPPPPWGWKTRPRDTNSLAPDAAVMSPNESPGWNPIFWPYPTNSWDLAFELISSPSVESKWEQVPDLTTQGMDVRATTNRNSSAQGHLLADNFQCTSPTYITNITIWGSYSNDFTPSVVTNVTFTLSIHDDIPDPDGPGPAHSMPGALRWMQTFTNNPMQYKCSIFASNLFEGWFSPPSLYLPFGDTICYQYEFNIAPGQAFLQEGTPTQPKVYWLDVQVLVPGLVPQFGWKTCITNWNDDAVWVNAKEPYSGVWNELRYPQGHPRYGDSMDLAFRLNATTGVSSETKKWSQPPVPYNPPDAFNGWNQLSVWGSANIVADDWVCTNATPVTDVHWWGSFIGWDSSTPPQMPDAFVLSIWTDVPKGTQPFSHPGICLTNIICANFICNFAGWDIDPRNPDAPAEACFKFEQELLESQWFTQAPGTNVYWISIAAMYGTTVPQYPWGWKTRPRDTNSLAPDDAVIIFYPTDPVPGMIYQLGTNICWPTSTNSWDMAFALTTRQIITATNDFGDAPTNYPTLLAQNGARHTVVPGIRLGPNIDAELDGQPNATATGDDINPPAGLDDEDGVVLFGLHMIPGGLSGVAVTASTNGYVSAWVDFNLDGSWATSGDQIFTNVWVTNGVNNLYFNVPFAIPRATNTFARFRFSTTTITNFTGLAQDGEVEDYRWYIEEVDFGDAPDPTFPTMYTNSGAYHWILLSPPVFLGQTVDSEFDGQPNATATGDDIAKFADEDGVRLLTPLLPGQVAIVQVNPSIANGYLSAWIDFGADGSWATAGDQIFNSLKLVNAGPTNLNFVVPANAATGSSVFARFRFSTTQNLSYTNIPGQVPNGEVEDYQWLISQLDFGDAPAPYPTLLANNGARHVIVPGFRLGSLEDGEANGLPNSLATGDDTNNLADEDGVSFVTPLIIGTQACVNVTLGGTNGGVLDAWVDFNTNGTWLDAGEQVLTSVVLVPGTNNFCFAVPASTVPGTTFARFRLSSGGNLSPTGQASDGEVEDYCVRLGWRRPSTNIVITNIVFTGKFNGWNEPSVLGGTNTVAADDWVCTTTNPITDIRWWGSFLNWQSNTPPTLPGAFQIAFWTDVPAGAIGGPFSHPGDMLGEIYCTNYTWQFVGWDVDPRTLAYEACFRFDQTLVPSEWFYQTNSPTRTNIYWLSIAAVYPQGVPSEHVWGWKTRPRSTNSPAPDDAVRFIFPQGPYQPLWWPDPTNSWDLAFELVCNYTNLIGKWQQPPDLSTLGIDVNDTIGGPGPLPYLLADDFPCTATGPLTDITIWGSWRYDLVPPPQFATFTLSIHNDVTNVFSMPGQLLWKQTFGPGQYQEQPLQVSQLEEGWLDPPATYIFPGDHNCFQYDFHVATNAFVQTNGTIYWLDVQAQLPLGAQAQFGWKTTPYVNNWHDAAVWVNGTEPYQGPWNELRRLWEPTPIHIDLAFRLATSQNVYQLKWSQPPVTNRYATVEWTWENDVHYQLQAVTNLTGAPTNLFWFNIGPEVIGPVHEQSDTNTSAPERYYRVIAPNAVP